jgi:raffinose/stachyose/melibiose transport system substrate-binding protein
MPLSLLPKARLRSLTAVLASASLAVLPIVGSSSPAALASPLPDASTISGTVNWWAWSPTDTATADAEIAAFNQAYPDIKVIYKLITIPNWVATLRPALLSGQGPDVFDMQPGSYVTEFNSFALDATPMAEAALGSNWKSKVAPSGISGLTYDGKLTGLSIGSVYAGTLWINEGLFQKYGLTAPTTLAQWVHVCQVFKAHKQGCFVQGASQEGFDQDTLQSIANSVQPGLWTQASRGTAKWSDPGIVKTLAIWKELFSDGVMQPGALGYLQYPDANNDFLTGKDAMVMMGTWYMVNTTATGMTSGQSAAGMSKPKPFVALPIQFPNVAGTTNTSAMYGDADWGLSVYTKSKNVPAAEKFVEWLTSSTAGQQSVANQLDDLPALRSISPDFNSIKLVDPKLQLGPIHSLIKQVGTVTEPRESALSADVQNAILTAAESVATGSATPQAAAQTLQSAAVASGETFK